MAAEAYDCAGWQLHVNTKEVLPEVRENDVVLTDEAAAPVLEFLNFAIAFLGYQVHKIGFVNLFNCHAK